MSENRDDIDWSLTTWEGSRRAQLRHALTLTLRERMEAVEGLADVARRLQEMRAQGEFKTASEPAEASVSAAASMVREPEAPYGTGSRRPLELRGCVPEPLGNYLKALGVFRLVAEQADPQARAWWQNGHFVLFSYFHSENELAEWFKNQYAPSLMPAPWSVNSGWWPPKDQPPPKGDKRGTANQHLRTLAKSFDKRFANVRQCLQESLQSISGTTTSLPDRETDLPTELGEFLKRLENPTKKSQTRAQLIGVLRNRLTSNSALRWIDAIGALSRHEDDALYPFQLLADCGAEGVNSYVGNYYARLCEHLPVTTQADAFWSGDAGKLSYQRLRAALLGEPYAQTRQKDAAGGLYSPALVEAPNIGQTFVATPKKRANPWDFILQMEGLLLWASAATRRAEVTHKEKPAFPFYCQSAVGGASAIGPSELSGHSDGKSRGEIWYPIWVKPSAFDEIDRLFVEGRVALGDRTATTATRFALAVSSYGLERGVASFHRVGLLERGGSGDQTTTLAVSLGIVPARRITGVDLASELDSFLDQIHDLIQHHPNQPRRIIAARCRLDQAIFDFASPQTDSASTVEPTSTLKLLTAAADLERHLGVTHGKVKFKIGRDLQSRTLDPIRPLSLRWVVGKQSDGGVSPCDDGTVEYRLARAIAGIAPWGESPEGGNVSAVESVRANLLPVIRHGNVWRWGDTSRSAVWAHGASLTDNLAAVLRRRLIDSARGQGDGLPLWSGYGALFGDLLAVWNREQDEQRLDNLIHALALVDTGRWKAEGIGDWQRKHDPTPDLHSSAVWFDADDEPRTTFDPPKLRGQPLLAPDELRYASELPRVYAVLKLSFVGGRLPARPIEGETVARTGDEPYPPSAPEILNLLQAGRLPEAVEIAVRKLRAKGYPAIFDPRLSDAPEITMSAADCRRLAGLLLIPIRHAGLLAALAIKPGTANR